MLTIGASHSSATARHFSSGTMSLRLVEYSRIRPQPVQVKLHVCSGSSCKTIANFGVLRSLCLMMWPAIFADNANGNRISLTDRRDLLWSFCRRSDREGCVGQRGGRGRRNMEQAAQHPAASGNQKI